MIRPLTDADRPQLASFLAANAHYNVYMLGNLESLGVQHDFSQFWGDCDEAAPQGLRGVVNRYMTGWSAFGLAGADWPGLAAVIDEYPQPAERLQDNPGGIDSFARLLTRYTVARDEHEELMTLAESDFQPTMPGPDVFLRPARYSDVERLLELYAHAGAMRRSRATILRPLDDGHFWIAEVAGDIRAAALTNAIGGGYAMIGGVFTEPEFRGRGIAQALCSALCLAILTDGLTPTLYWAAADAGHIYRKLGFRRVGEWRSIWLQPTPQQGEE